MTITRADTHMTPDEVLRAVEGLRPTIAARAAEVEGARRVPPDLVRLLVDAGAFRIVRPTQFGGIGASLPDALRVFQSVARADGSVGWTVTLGAGAWFDLVNLPRAGFERLFEDRDAIVAGAFNPAGSIAAHPDGYRVSGRWGFVTGCQHADWLFGNCIESLRDDGVPELRVAVFSPDQVVIEDTWHASGLRGSGSHHVRATDVTVAADMTAPSLAENPCFDDPVVHLPVPAVFALAIASVAVGNAQGALDDVEELATTKMPLLASAPLATNALYQFDLASARTELHAARALLTELAETAWDRAVRGVPTSLDDRAMLRAAGVWATHRAAAVARSAYLSGGGSSVYEDCPLQRRLRDADAITQHFLVKRDALTTAGAAFAGQEVQVPAF